MNDHKARKVVGSFETKSLRSGTAPVRRLVFAIHTGVKNFRFVACRSKVLYVCLDAFKAILVRAVYLSQTNYVGSRHLSRDQTVMIVDDSR